MHLLLWPAPRTVKVKIVRLPDWRALFTYVSLELPRVASFREAELRNDLPFAAIKPFVKCDHVLAKAIAHCRDAAAKAQMNKNWGRQCHRCVPLQFGTCFDGHCPGNCFRKVSSVFIFFFYAQKLRDRHLFLFLLYFKFVQGCGLAGISINSVDELRTSTATSCLGTSSCTFSCFRRNRATTLAGTASL